MAKAILDEFLSFPKKKKVHMYPLRCKKKTCCCNCRYLLVDHHPFDQQRGKKGYVCAAPEFEVVFSGWDEHGLCEMWSKRPADWPGFM